MRTFAHTYATELRSERQTRYLELYSANSAYFDALHEAFAGQPHPPQTAWGWAGLVPLVTGLVGFCPLYAVLGINTCSIRQDSA